MYEILGSIPSTTKKKIVKEFTHLAAEAEEGFQLLVPWLAAGVGGEPEGSLSGRMGLRRGDFRS